MHGVFIIRPLGDNAFYLAKSAKRRQRDTSLTLLTQNHTNRRLNHELLNGISRYLHAFTSLVRLGFRRFWGHCCPTVTQKW